MTDDDSSMNQSVVSQQRFGNLAKLKTGKNISSNYSVEEGEDSDEDEKEEEEVKV